MDMGLSVLMAVRNGEAHLREALDTILGQTIRDFELIVVDDGSGDGTRRILDEYLARDARLRVLRNTSARGLAASLNRGLQCCGGELVARADADDAYHPERLARQVDYLRRHPEIGVLSCGYHRIDAAGAHLGTIAPVTGHEWIGFRMMFINSLLHPGALFRQDVVRAAGGYDPRYWTAQDSDLWARLLRLTKFDNLPEPLVYYRVHPLSMVRRRGEEGQRLSLSVPARLQAQYLGRRVAPDEARAMVHLYQRARFLHQSEVETAYRGMRDVAAFARERECPVVRKQFHRAVAGSMVHQARLQASKTPIRSARVLAKALEWYLARH